MRQEVKDYVSKIIKEHPIPEPICEIGSLQVPGQEGFADLRPLFSNKKYIGCDYQLGTGVDRQENTHYLTLRDNSIGTVLILDTLEHVANVYRAIDEIYRVLRPGGLVILSSVMNFPIHNYPQDYWRFTPQAFELLLEKFETHKVTYDGNKDFPTGIYGYGIKTTRNTNKIKYDFRVNLKDTNSTLTKIVNFIGEHKKVLEFGCSTGYMSKILKQNGCEVIGIEINRQASKIARKYCKKIINGDIEQLEYEQVLGNTKFDYIVFADVVEHLKDPLSVLVKIKKSLKKEGKVIISVPNIAHASIRLELLTGEFEYEKAGILDESHLKFFTKRSIMRLLDSCGYYIEHIDAVSKGLSHDTIARFLTKVGLRADEEIVKIFNQPEALAYQYFIVASTKKPTRYSLIGVLSKQIKTINYQEKIFNSREWKIISFLHKIRLKIPYLRHL